MKRLYPEKLLEMDMVDDMLNTQYEREQKLRELFSFFGVLTMLLASPVGMWCMKKWLESFAYRITVDWSIAFMAGAMALIIAMVTVGWQASKAALANPVENLRNE